jgi:hypothetical protein
MPVRVTRPVNHHSRPEAGLKERAMTDSLTLSDERAAAVSVAPRVTKADIEAKIAAVNWTTADKAFGTFGAPSLEAHKLLTICVITMQNGFTFLGKSACASPENFNAELGSQLAYEDAFRQIWPVEAYVLRNELAGRA